MPKRRIKVQPFTPEPLNVHDFNILVEVLFELHNQKFAACARSLGISVRTFQKWYTDNIIPTWPHWNLVLEPIISKMLMEMQTRRNSFTARQQTWIRTEMAKLSNAHSVINKIQFQTAQLQGSQDHLRKLLMRGGMYTADIFKAANTGGYSRAALYHAARELSIVKDIRGFGPSKKTYWRLPTVESDLDNEEDGR